MSDTKRKIALVTGGASGIGKAIVLRFVREKFEVISVDVNPAAAIGLSGLSNVHSFVADVCREDDVKKLFQKIKNEFGILDVLVNNAGIIRDNMIWNMSLSDFEAVLDVNLKGPWLMCREAAVMMKVQNHGRIINIVSRAWLGNRGQSNYSSSKAGLVGMTRVLALELGKYNVLVNAVAPGLIDTPLTQKLEKDVLDKLISAQPTRTMGKPDDVANAVAFLAADETQFITGQTLYVDGGKSIGAGT